MKTINIYLEVRELVYDIQNKAHLVGKAEKNLSNKNAEAIANIQLSDEDDEMYQIKRSLNTAYSRLLLILFEYISSKQTAEGINKLNEIIDENGTLEIEFRLTDNYHDSATQTLTDSIHSYLVNVSLAEWLAVMDKDYAQIYATLSESDVKAIIKSLYCRKRPVKPQKEEEI